jgi:hypothetical protein
MQCPSCSYPIEQQNLDRCPRCGRSLTAQSESPAPSHPPQPQQSSPYPQQSPQSGYGAPPPSSAPPAGYAQPYGQGTPPNYPPGYYQSPYPPSAYFQPTLAPVPPRKNPTGLIVGIVALVVVVLAVCTGGTIFAVRSLGNLKSIRSLRTVTVASPTPAPTATAMPVRTVIYQNSLASNADGWSNDVGKCFWKSDGYHVTNSYECYAPTGAQTSVDVSVRAQQVSGGPTTPYGIVFGLDDKNNDYEFMIVSDSAWALFRCVGLHARRQWTIPIITRYWAVCIPPTGWRC